jgi:quercetin dioxygenase-like cupin family protein
MTMSNLARHKFSVPLDRDQVAHDWKKRGYSCDLFTDPPGREWNDFVHTTNELVTVVVGKLRLTIGDEEIVAEPGDEVFIPRGILHSVKNIASSTTQWLYGYNWEGRHTRAQSTHLIKPLAGQ